MPETAEGLPQPAPCEFDAHYARCTRQTLPAGYTVTCRYLGNSGIECGFTVKTEIDDPSGTPRVYLRRYAPDGLRISSCPRELDDDIIDAESGFF